MNFTESIWNGFRRIDFEFKGRQAILVFPDKPDEGGKWMYKTEYFGAFPEFELQMLGRGWHLAYLANKSRWCLPEDISVKPEFCEFLAENFGLNKKCLPVGMSCGGMHAVYFGADYPEYVAGLYIDAPVMNLLSCPGGVGGSDGSMLEEFSRHTGMTLSELINYRNHPIDNVAKLIEARVPVFLVCGDSDTVVPFEENGKQLFEKYTAAGADITLVLKPGCDHHPHGPEDNAPLIAFAERCYG